MSNLMKDVEDWFRERDKWLQDAARRLVQYGEVTDADINELVMFLASLKCSVPELNYCSTLVPVLAIDGRVF